MQEILIKWLDWLSFTPGFNRVFRSYVIARNRFNRLPLSAIATQLRNR